MTIHPLAERFPASLTHDRFAIPSVATDSSRPLMLALDGLDQGLVLTTGTARILYANRAGREMLGLGPLACGGVLSGVTAAGTRQLRRRIADAAEGDGGAFLRLVLPGAAPPLLLTIAVAEATEGSEPTVLVFVGREKAASVPRPDMLEAFFGLTPAEARMACEIVRGDGLKACAGRLKVSVNTARTHLNHVFEKTGTRRQAELVMVLMNCCPAGVSLLAASSAGRLRMSRSC